MPWHHSLLNINNFHFLIYSLLRILLMLLLLRVTLTLFPNWCVTFWTYIERLDVLLRPWLQSINVRLLNTETGVVWCVQEWYPTNWSVLTEWKEVWARLFWLVCDEGNVKFVVRVLTVYLLFLHSVHFKMILII